MFAVSQSDHAMPYLLEQQARLVLFLPSGTGTYQFARWAALSSWINLCQFTLSLSPAQGGACGWSGAAVGSSMTQGPDMVHSDSFTGMLMLLFTVLLTFYTVTALFAWSIWKLDRSGMTVHLQLGHLASFLVITINSLKKRLP